MPFSTFAGNSRIVQRLRVKLRENRFPHGLIFAGPDGIGKRTCALMVAKTLNCLQAEGDDFCDMCAQCRKINAGVHADVLRIGVEDDASEIKIAQIRELLRTLDFRPLEGRSKIFIIDPANAMKAAAANALLKGLEEPPTDSFFILLNPNVHELMPTIRSRCQAYAFTPIELEELRRMESPDRAPDELVLRWAQGSVGLLRTLDSASLRRQRDSMLDFLEIAVGSDETAFREVLAASQELGRAKNEFESNLGTMTILLADVMYLQEGAPEKVINIDIITRLEDLTNRVNSERIIRVAEFFRTIESNLRFYINRQMMTDVLALTANDSVAKILNDNPSATR